MDIKELTYILTIAQEGSISKAADKLYLSQSALSQFLSRYESTLNTPLFFRTSKGVNPTYAGLRFVEAANRIVSEYNRLISEISRINQIETGQISIGIPNKRTNMLTEILGTLNRQYPNVSIILLEAPSAHLEHELRQGNVDFAIVIGPTQCDTLNYRYLASEEMYLTTASTHPINRHLQKGSGAVPWVDLTDIQNEDFIIQEKGHRTYDFAMNFFESNDIHPRSIKECSSFDISIAWASIGAGIAFLPQTFLKHDEITSRNLSYFSAGKNGCSRDFYIAYSETTAYAAWFKPVTDLVRSTLINYFDKLGSITP